MVSEVIIASLGIFVGELYGNLVGGGSLVTQAVLQNILHFDIKTAMALDNAGIIGSNVGMLLVLIRKYRIQAWHFFFILFQMLGAKFGALILIHINIALLKSIFLISIVALVVKNLFFNPPVRKNTGFVFSPGKLVSLAVVALFIGTYNAAFVIGDWIIALMLLTTIFNFQYHKAVFLLVFTQFFTQPFVAYQYFQAGLVDLKLVTPMVCATLLAGIISGLILNKLHSHKLERLLKYLSILLVLYLAYGLI